MKSGNTLHDDDRYEFVPPMVSPISDDSCNPDSIRFADAMGDGTVTSTPVPRKPKGRPVVVRSEGY